MTKQKIKPEPGYRFLKKGDIIKAGDRGQSVYGGRWFDCISCVGEKADSNKTTIYRMARKVELKVEKPKTNKPEPGYQLLKDGEIIKDGDRCGWKQGTPDWMDSKWAIGKRVGSFIINYTIFTRKKVWAKEAVDKEIQLNKLNLDKLASLLDVTVSGVVAKVENVLKEKAQLEMQLKELKRNLQGMVSYIKTT
jgi:hypothetical protein